MPRTEFSAKRDVIQKVLEEIATEISRETGWKQRESKLSGAVFAELMVIGHLEHPEARLSDLVLVAADLGVSISESGLHQRIDEAAVVFFQQLLARSLALWQPDTPLPGWLSQMFKAVYVVDSSIIILPPALQALYPGFQSAGTEAAVKIQLGYDYLRGQVVALEVGPGCQNDQSCTLARTLAEKNSLYLLDLGYFNLKTWVALDALGAWFVSRYKHGTNLYAQAADTLPLDLAAWLAHEAPDTVDITCYLGARQRVPIRLIAQRLPPHLVDERRRKAIAAARKKGHTCSSSHLELLAWSVFITNVPATRLPAAAILLLYRLRWQIELLFKLWKSEGALDVMGPYRPPRLLVQFYARLIALLLFHFLVAPWRRQGPVELSLPKAFRLLRHHAVRLLDSIAHHWRSTAAVLKRLVHAFLTRASQARSRKKPSTLHQLLGATS